MQKMTSRCRWARLPTMYERYRVAHFGRRDVPIHMSEIGGEGSDGCVTRQVLLWDSRYLTS